ncbi:MAG: hypothetical protein R6W70_08590 [bacterium]
MKKRSEKILKKTCFFPVILLFFIIVFMFGNIFAAEKAVKFKNKTVKDYTEESVWIFHISGGATAGVFVSSDKNSFSKGPLRGKRIAPLLNAGIEYARLYDGKFAMSGSIQTDLYYGYLPVLMPGIGVHLSSDNIKQKGAHILKVAGHFPVSYLKEFWAGYGWSAGYDYTITPCIAIGLKVQAVTLFSVKNGSSFEMAFHSVYDTLAGITLRF